VKIVKIDYINLLPFHIFLKKYIRSSIQQSAINYKKSFPSNINKEFKAKRAHLAFISSIASKKANKTSVGIVAKRDVQSVIAIPGEYMPDFESATSNILAKILGIDGKVYIGDKALKIALRNQNHIDLAQKWQEKYKLPFVFAVLCFNKDPKIAIKLATKFTSNKIKIPQIILEKYSKTRKISKKDIQNYLTKISYKIGKKEQLGYKKFIKLAKNIRS